MAIETLDTEGFLFTETAGEWALLTADFGEGYEAGALIGHPDGLRTWSITIGALPGEEGIAPAIEDTGETRARYLWNFFQRSKAAGNLPFYIEVEDPADGTRKLFFASFVDHKLSYEVLCAQAYSTGLQLKQRRIKLTPGLVAGCVAWAEARNNTEADGAAVASMADLSGAGATIANADSDTRPVMKIESGVRMIRHGGAALHLEVTLAEALDPANATVFMVARNNRGGASSDYGFLLTLKDQTSGGLVTENTAPFGEVSWLTNAQFGGGSLLGAEFKVLAARTAKGATGSPGPGVLVRSNSRQNFRTQNQASVGIGAISTTSSTCFVGVFAPEQTFQLIGDWKAFAIYDRPLTDAEIEALCSYFSTAFDLSEAAPQNLIVVDGDSLSAGGFGTALPARPWPDRMLINQTPTFKAYNFAVQGQTCAQMLADQATQVLPVYDSTKENNILLAWCGTNDLAAASVVPQLKLDYAAYCNAARTKGFKVIAFTILPRAGGVGTFETDRQTFNTWLRLQTFYEALCDVGADTTIGEAGDNTNETNYQTDHTHLNTTGHGIVEDDYATPALNGLL